MNMKINNKKLFWWCATLGLMIGIFIFSSQPSVKSSALSGEIVEKVVKPILHLLHMKYHEFYHTLVRKTAHFTFYGLLGISAFNLLQSYQIRKTLFPSLVICFLYACSDEYHQTFVPGRSGQFSDVCIDLAGSLFAILTMLFLRRVVKNRIKRV